MSAQHIPAMWQLAAAIVDSDNVVSTYAASEWDELSDDGKAWIVAIVAETLERAGSQDLLEALKVVNTFAKATITRIGLSDTNGICAAADAAIAKAEGRA